MAAAAVDTNLVVLDVATRWRIDAALFLAAGAGFLGWSVAQGHASGAFVGVGRTLLISAASGGIAIALGDVTFAGGFFGAYAVIHLIGAARARRVERRDRVALRVSVGRRRHAYYVTSPALRGVSGG